FFSLFTFLWDKYVQLLRGSGVYIHTHTHIYIYIYVSCVTGSQNAKIEQHSLHRSTQPLPFICVHKVLLFLKSFMSKPSSKPVTTEFQVAETEMNDLHVRVIDSPDIFDDDTEPTVWDKHVKKCKQLCGSEPCVYVLVMHVSRFTDCERHIMEKLEKAFGREVKEKTVVLFTRGDDLQQAKMSLKDFLHSCQPGLREIVEKCGNRCVLFENSSSDSQQVVELFRKIDNMVDVNGGTCYTNEMYRGVEAAQTSGHGIFNYIFLALLQLIGLLHQIIRKKENIIPIH
uniref:AIG1-type G domain-containing protein n=1 Tax=Oreochromis niloticus TaxID=8128 RepID=A0A669DPL5_ORENI